MGTISSMGTLYSAVPRVSQSGNICDFIMHFRRECVLKLKKDYKSQKSQMTMTKQFSGHNRDIELTATVAAYTRPGYAQVRQNIRMKGVKEHTALLLDKELLEVDSC